MLQNDQCKVGKKRKLEQHSLKFFMAQFVFFFLVTKVYLGRMRNNFFSLNCKFFQVYEHNCCGIVKHKLLEVFLRSSVGKVRLSFFW